MPRLPYYLLLVLSLVLARAHNSIAQCTWLAADAFDYPAGEPLHGQAGGAGWAGPWQVQNEDVQLPGYQVEAGNPLSYDGLLSSTAYVSGGRAYLTSGRRLNTSEGGPFADFVSGELPYIGGAPQGDTLWMSAVLRHDAGNGSEAYLDLTNSDLPACNSYEFCSDQRIGIGYFGQASDVNGEPRWSLRLGEEVLPSTAAVAPGASALLVLRLAFHTGATHAALFVSPEELGGQPPSAPDVAAAAPEAYLLRSLAYFGGSQPGFSSLDEVRFARSFACAAPDEDTVVDEPPVANIMVSPEAIGIAPLPLMFDGSSSIDPEGGELSYLWDFGDGSPTVAGPTAAHTYTDGGGQVTASLTVTDEAGQQSIAFATITLLGPDGTFPCLSTVTALAMADCSGNGAQLRINTPNESVSYTLAHDGINLPPGTDGLHTGLSTGLYELAVMGENGCSESRVLEVQVDSSACEGWSPGNKAMLIGTNINGQADWMPHRPFRNFLKNTRGAPIPYTTDCSCWSLDDPEAVLSQMAFDENGYPVGLPQATTEGDVRLRFFVSAEGQNMRPGETYVLLYEGVGEVSVHGTLGAVSAAPGRVQFELETDGTFWFHLEASQADDPVRDIRVVRLADEGADLQAAPFYDKFLERLEPFQSLRFMDMMHTNNNPLTDWGSRPLPAGYTYGTAAGAPYEVLIQLANTLQKDIWVCVPHQADEAYVRKMAELFYDELDPGLMVFLEYSNEVWNWIFDQAHYNVEHNPLGLMYGRAMAVKAQRVFRIWHEVFGDERCRVKRVLGLQGGFNYLNEHILAHLPQEEWDFGSPTHYFGLDHGETGSPRLDLLGSSATVADVMANARHSFSSFSQAVRQDYRNVQVYGKEVITYEGGQHFVGNVFGIPYPYQQAMWDAQHTESMYELYEDVLDSLRAWGCRMATNFSLAGQQESIYGSWGVLDDIDQEGPFAATAPKYQVHLDNMPAIEAVAAQRMAWLDCAPVVGSSREAGTAVAGKEVLIYPNPGQDWLFLEYDGPAEETWLMDWAGRALARGAQKEFYVPHCPPGLYLVRVGDTLLKWVKAGN